jgi:hypothetical protein
MGTETNPVSVERDWPYLDRVKALNDDLRVSIAEQSARADAAEAEVERLRAQVEAERSRASAFADGKDEEAQAADANHDAWQAAEARASAAEARVVALEAAADQWLAEERMARRVELVADIAEQYEAHESMWRDDEQTEPND